MWDTLKNADAAAAGRGLGIYVHLPWCVRKCPYCDFNSHAAPAEIPEARYVTALLADLDLDLADLDSGRHAESMFFGGGTPSLFSPDAIARIIDGVRTRMKCADDMEITLEANPGTVEHGRFAGYRQAGVNRISLGAQSFAAAQLQALGRIHSVGDIGRAVDELIRGGFDNFNLDLMYALPEQNLADAARDVASAIALQPTHISYYELTLEPGTAFYHRPPALPDGERAWEMQLQGQAALAASGYEQYEVSAYAHDGRRCHHNLNYWTYGDYLGIGAGAHGKYSRPRGEGGLQITRTVRQRQPREYLSREPNIRVTDRRDIPEEERAFEFMLNALRLPAGFDRATFETRTGLPAASIDIPMRMARQRGLVEEASEWRPTPLGLRFLNDLQTFFLPPASPA